MHAAPKDIQLIENELAIVWPDGVEDFFQASFLRQHSPSAENIGEKDLFGKTHGGTEQTEFSGVDIANWKYVGNYAICIHFSDGHNTGIYSWEYLWALRLLRAS